MNALELVVDDGHLDQRIGITQLVVIDIAHQVVHQGGYLVIHLRPCASAGVKPLPRRRASTWVSACLSSANWWG